MIIQLGDIRIQLLPEGGVILPESRTLVIADVHLGKSATFRSLGIPIPEGDTHHDLTKISKMIDLYEIEKLVIAGDLVHANAGLTEHVLESLATWLVNLNIPVILTEGNHDRKAKLPALQIEIVSEVHLDGLLITHFPQDLVAGQPGLAGHVHPAYQLKATQHRPIHLKGFHLMHPHHLVLPAFSQFTGNFTITPEPEDQFFSTTNDQLHHIPLP